MPRGTSSPIGTTFVNKNGYHSTRTIDGWRLTHHLVAEKKLGRPLQDTEIVRFKDGNRANLAQGNIIIIDKGNSTLKKQLARLEARIAELQARKADIELQLANGKR